MKKKPNKKSFAEMLSKLESEPLNENNVIETFKSNPSTNYPLFGFKYLNDCTHKGCNDVKFMKSFLERLNKLSNLGWNIIEKSDRHAFGAEKISIDKIYPNLILPDKFKRHTSLTVFRATGDNHVFAGIREENTFHIFFIESQFGLLYQH